MTEIPVGIISLALGMLIILILSLIPIESILIDQLDSSITISSDSQWNNPNIMSGRSFWNLISNLMYPFGLICIIFGFYKTLKDIRE